MRLAFSSLACPGWTVEEIVRAADRYGYQGIEWRLADGALLGPKTDDAIWEVVKTCGVQPVCLDTSCVFVQPHDEGRLKAIEYAAAMGQRAVAIGAPAIRVFGGALPDGASRADVTDVTARALAEAATKMPFGVDLLVETHDAWSRGSDIAEITSGEVGVVWDIAHSHRAGESPRETLHHIATPGLVHVKDARGEELVHFGDGDVPTSDAITALRENGYKDWLCFEWEKLWHPELDDPDVALPRANEYLRRLLADR